MSTDRSYRVLMAVIQTLPERTPVTADTIRDAADQASLTSAEKSAAFKAACRDGYLRGVTMLIDGEAQPVSMRTTHPAGKGRYSRLYRRTGKAVPAHVCT